MRILLRLALGLSPMFGVAQPQAIPSPGTTRSSSTEDPVLESLIQEALQRNPDLAKSRTLTEAERERVPQAKALPDPSLSLGIQNDGFKDLQIGKMETSFYQVMATQPLPWPGKRGKRGEIASTSVEIARTVADRTRLTLEADVKRAYYGLLLVRDQLALLEEQAKFLEQAQAVTKVRYEVGQGSQADLLRAQLERNRLNQSRQAFLGQEKGLVASLNRLRGITEFAPVPTSRSLASAEVSALPAQEALSRAEAASPELKAAQLGVRQAEQSLDLAKLDRRPDFAVSAGVMPRGSLDPMWQVGFSISLPIWSKNKQQRAVSEQEWRRKAQGSEVESVRNLLVQRVQERTAQLESTLETLGIYRGGLLIQSEASFRATMVQYEAGRVPFLSVLETLNGWVADRSGMLQSIAQAKALQIAQEEVNLSGTPSISAQGLGAPAMGMGGSPSSGGTPSSASTSRPAATAGGSGSSPMKSM